MAEAVKRWWVAAVALLVFVTRMLARARVPDDYDSIGFVRALGEFDLEKLQPHFPGYPVYVAGARALRLIVGDPLLALTTVSALAAAATSWAVWRLARAAGDEWGAVASVLLYACASLPWLLGGAALSDSLATALTLLAFAELSLGRPWLSGLWAGLALGARLSYWPLGASWLALLAWRGRERRIVLGLTGATLGTVAWAAPLIGLVGARRLYALGRLHLIGHFTEWGGSIVTRPSLSERARAFARDLLYDGLAPNAWALAALTLVVFLVLWARRRSQASCASLPPFAGAVAVACLPYALWVFFAQNVVEQPRHLLPLAVGVTLAFGPVARGRRALALAMPALVLLASAPLAWARATSRPAAWQAARWLDEQYPQGQVALFGGSSLRFFSPRAGLHLGERTWLSEVDVELERVDVFPELVLVTSEVTADPRRQLRLRERATFCRDARLDRAQPCLSLRVYTP